MTHFVIAETGESYDDYIARITIEQSEDLRKLAFDLVQMTLFATSAGAQFDCLVANLPVVSIEKILRYGFQRFVNDYANTKGNGESDQTKRDLASVRIGDLIKGEFQKARKPKTPDELKLKRDLVLAQCSKEQKQEFAKAEDKGVSEIDKLWEANESELLPLFEAEMKRREEKANEPKVKLKSFAV